MDTTLDTPEALAPLREALELARAEEAEALRRALNLRSRGANYAEMQAAMREADSCHAQVTRLQIELKQQVR